MRTMAVIGAGGHAREVLDVVDAHNVARPHDPISVVGLLADPPPGDARHEAYGVSYLGSVDRLADLPAEVEFVVGIGDGAVRLSVARLAGSRSAGTLIHPSASLGREVRIAPGVVVLGGVSVANHIDLGAHVHLNRGVTVGHDVVLGEGVMLSPNVAVSGNVRIGPRTFVGAGAVINPGLTIGADCVIGSGAAVIGDVPAGATVGGVPARPLH